MTRPAEERARGVAFVVVGAALALYYAFGDSLGTLSLWGETLVVALVLIPAVFTLVWAVLPFRAARGLGLLALALAALAAVLELGGIDTPANFAKLAAMTAVGFWFLTYFDRLSWVAVVAAMIPVIDSLSVWRGPTRHIVTEQREIFTTLSFAFPVPGGAGSANLGLPDLLFFALFLAAAVRWRLRVNWTWVAMVIGLALTMILAVSWDVGGLPALPGIALGFLAANADLVWRDLRGRRPEPGGAPDARPPERVADTR